jgi:thiosulfate dehydrogenase [quinone] large subunit
MPRAKKKVTSRNSRVSRSKKVSKNNSQRADDKKLKGKPFWVIMRLAASFLFIWPFLDKTFGFGLTTKVANAWINGGSPIAGFLTHGTSGPLAGIFQSMAGSGFVSWLFMLGLLFVGLTMLLGIGMKLGAIVGTAMLFLMYIAALPTENNPFLDEHWFYAFALIASALTHSGNYFGLGKWWSNLKFVKKCKILE